MVGNAPTALRNLKRLRTYCLSLPETTEVQSWGHPNFRAGKRTFATFEEFQGIPWIAFRIDSAERSILLQDARFAPTPYSGNRGWISVRADRTVSWDLLQDIALKAYTIVATGRMVRLLETNRQTNMPTSADVLKKLRARGSKRNIAGMKRFGIVGKGRLGVSMPDIRRIAKEIGQDHELALKLWKSEVADARIVASIIADPQKLTSAGMDRWAADFDSWDVCDQVSMNLFQRSPLALRKIREWARRDEEFVRRAAFALMACEAWHGEGAPDTAFNGMLSLIRRHASDERNFVKKAVNWALRNIGKRNLKLNRAAVRAARELTHMESRSARWIGADALRELTGAQVQQRLRRSR
jgi:3-methyladenine DNA glycosylase AlkD/predicted DNA-binding protein (MmcQ/YjbR family)